MSDNESSQGSQEEEPLELPNMLEQLKGDNPKIFGFDYYKVIYAAAGALTFIMGLLYAVIDDKELKQMVLIQGFLSVGLLCAALYFRTKMQAASAQEKLEKLRQEREQAKAKSNKSKRKRK